MALSITTNAYMDRTEQLEHDIRRLRLLTPTSTLVDALLTLALEWFVNDAEHSVVLIREAEQLSHALPYPAGLIYAQLVEGYVELWRGQNATARTSADTGLANATAIAHVRLQGLAHELRSSIYHKAGQVGQALAAALVALEFLEQAQDTYQIASVCNLIGICYSRLFEPAKAAVYFERSIALCQASGAFRHLAQIHNNLAMNYCRAQEADKAEIHAHHANALIQSHVAEYGYPPYADAYGYLYINLASVAQLRKAWDAALRYITAGLEANAPTPTKRASVNLQSSLLRTQGEILLGKGDLEAAERTFLETLSLVAPRGIQRDMARIHMFLAQIYKQQGDFVRALLHHEQYHVLDKALFTEQHAQQVAMTQTLLETQAARREADLLTHKNTELEELVIELQALHTQVKEMSQRDGLTGLFNRRYLDDQLPMLFNAALQTGQPICAIMSDIDNFKMINDAHRHQTGDDVLRQLGVILEAVLADFPLEAGAPRPFAARYGGEEFAIVLPNTPIEMARHYGELLCRTVREHTWETLSPDLNVTVSVGVSDHRHLMHPEDLLRRADDALYAAKHTGKNRVWVFMTRKKNH